MGLGLALMEETLFDERSGRIMNPSLAEYHVPVHLDVPEIDVIWTDIPDPHAPMGARGIGEIGITGVGGGDRQRGLQRHRQARARPADHARQAAGLKGGDACQPSLGGLVTSFVGSARRAASTSGA